MELGTGEVELGTGEVELGAIVESSLQQFDVSHSDTHGEDGEDGQNPCPSPHVFSGWSSAIHKQ